MYFIEVARWKGKLKKELLPVVDDHCTYLEKESVAIVDDTLGATREVVEANFVRRAQVISDALAARENQRRVRPEEFDQLAARWDEQMKRLESVLKTL